MTQDRLQTTQEGAKTAQDHPKTTQERTKTAQRAHYGAKMIESLLFCARRNKGETCVQGVRPHVSVDVTQRNQTCFVHYDKPTTSLFGAAVFAQ